MDNLSPSIFSLSQSRSQPSPQKSILVPNVSNSSVQDNLKKFQKQVEICAAKINSLNTSPNWGDIKRLQSSLRDLREPSVTWDLYTKYLKLIISYIDIVMQFIQGQYSADFQKQMRHTGSLLNSVSANFHRETGCSIFVERAAYKVFNLLLLNINPLIMKIQLLRMLNGIISLSRKDIRENVGNEKIDYLYRLFDWLSNLGDYLAQIMVLKIIFNMFGENIKSKPEYSLFPGNEELGRELINININTINGDARTWLNKLNEKYEKICSFAFKTIHMGNKKCECPNEGDFKYIDFNIREKILSFYIMDPDSGPEDNNWNRIFILENYVEHVEIESSKSFISLSIVQTNACVSEKLSMQQQMNDSDLNMKILLINDGIIDKLMLVLTKIFRDKFMPPKTAEISDTFSDQLTYYDTTTNTTSSNSEILQMSPESVPDKHSKKKSVPLERHSPSVSDEESQLNTIPDAEDTGINMAPDSMSLHVSTKSRTKALNKKDTLPLERHSLAGTVKFQPPILNEVSDRGESASDVLAKSVRVSAKKTRPKRLDQNEALPLERHSLAGTVKFQPPVLNEIPDGGDNASDALKSSVHVSSKTRPKSLRKSEPLPKQKHSLAGTVRPERLRKSEPLPQQRQTLADTVKLQAPTSNKISDGGDDASNVSVSPVHVSSKSGSKSLSKSEPLPLERHSLAGTVKLQAPLSNKVSDGGDDTSDVSESPVHVSSTSRPKSVNRNEPLLSQRKSPADQIELQQLVLNEIPDEADNAAEVWVNSVQFPSESRPESPNQNGSVPLEKISIAGSAWSPFSNVVPHIKIVRTEVSDPSVIISTGAGASDNELSLDGSEISEVPEDNEYCQKITIIAGSYQAGIEKNIASLGNVEHDFQPVKYSTPFKKSVTLRLEDTNEDKFPSGKFKETQGAFEEYSSMIVSDDEAVDVSQKNVNASISSVDSFDKETQQVEKNLTGPNLGSQQPQEQHSTIGQYFEENTENASLKAKSDRKCVYKQPIGLTEKEPIAHKKTHKNSDQKKEFVSDVVPSRKEIINPSRENSTKLGDLMGQQPLTQSISPIITLGGKTLKAVLNDVSMTQTKDRKLPKKFKKTKRRAVKKIISSEDETDEENVLDSAVRNPEKKDLSQARVSLTELDNLMGQQSLKSSTSPIITLGGKILQIKLNDISVPQKRGQIPEILDKFKISKRKHNKKINRKTKRKDFRKIISTEDERKNENVLDIVKRDAAEKVCPRNESSPNKPGSQECKISNLVPAINRATGIPSDDDSVKVLIGKSPLLPPFDYNGSSGSEDEGDASKICIEQVEVHTSIVNQDDQEEKGTQECKISNIVPTISRATGLPSDADSDKVLVEEGPLLPPLHYNGSSGSEDEGDASKICIEEAEVHTSIVNQDDQEEKGNQEREISKFVPTKKRVQRLASDGDDSDEPVLEKNPLPEDEQSAIKIVIEQAEEHNIENQIDQNGKTNMDTNEKPDQSKPRDHIDFVPANNLMEESTPIIEINEAFDQRKNKYLAEIHANKILPVLDNPAVKKSNRRRLYDPTDFSYLDEMMTANKYQGPDLNKEPKLGENVKFDKNRKVDSIVPDKEKTFFDELLDTPVSIFGDINRTKRQHRRSLDISVRSLRKKKRSSKKRHRRSNGFDVDRTIIAAGVTFFHDVGDPVSLFKAISPVERKRRSKFEKSNRSAMKTPTPNKRRGRKQKVNNDVTGKELEALMNGSDTAAEPVKKKTPSPDKIQQSKGKDDIDLPGKENEHNLMDIFSKGFEAKGAPFDARQKTNVETDIESILPSDQIINPIDTAVEFATNEPEELEELPDAANEILDAPNRVLVGSDRINILQNVVLIPAKRAIMDHGDGPIVKKMKVDDAEKGTISFYPDECQEIMNCLANIQMDSDRIKAICINAQGRQNLAASYKF